MLSINAMSILSKISVRSQCWNLTHC